MSSELVRHEMNIDELARVAKMLSLSGYFEAKGDSDVAIAQIATKILAGRELGYGPFASVNGIHVIKGKPAVSANLMAAAVKAHPNYDYRVRENNDQIVAIEFFQHGESLGTSQFSMKDAKAAGLTSDMWRKYARNMLFARAISNGVRWYCPDVFAGNAVYTPEELGDNDSESEYVVVESTSQPDPELTQNTEETTQISTTSGIEEWNEGLSPDDIALIDSWETPQDAQDWAVAMSACENEFEARNSFAKIVTNHLDGHLTKGNLRQAFVLFLKRQAEKMDSLSE